MRVGAVSARARGALALPALCAAGASAALLQGGFYGGQLAIVLVLLAAGVLASGLSGGIDRGSRAAFGILAASLAAAVVANGWTSAAAKPCAILAAAYLAFVLGARIARHDGAITVLDALVVLGAIVAVVGFTGLLLHDPRLAMRAETWRLSSSLTYQNAAGGLLALTLPAALVRARANATARYAAVLIAAALVLSQSRGAVVAAAVGVCVMLASRAVTLRALCRPVVAAAVVAAGFVPVVLDARGGLAAVPCAVALAWWITSGRASRRSVLAVIVIVGALGVAVVLGTRVGAHVDPWSNDRARVWSATADLVRARPVFGTGPGSYMLIGPKDGQIVRTRFAHNEYLQAAAETGIVGLAGIAVAGVLLARALRRARSGAAARGAALATGTIFAIHSLFDFIWHVPLLVIAAFAALGAAIGDVEGGES